jgi:uncharacterized protein
MIMFEEPITDDAAATAMTTSNPVADEETTNDSTTGDSTTDDSPTRTLQGRAITIIDTCCGVLATHILTDSFASLRPGTSPTDHVASWIFPIAALALIAWGVRRVRAGKAALITGLLGIAASIGGIAAPAAALFQGRVDAATVTGTLGAAAGLALVFIGSMLAFRARRPGGARVRRYARRLGNAVLTFALVLLVAAPMGMGYVVANRSGRNQPTGDLGRDHLDITLHTLDGLDLAASYVPSRNGAAVIVFPGRSASQVERRARMLTGHDYGVLVLDQRGQGGSEGDPNLLGWSSENDLRAAIAYLQDRPDVERGRIGGLGLSVGGELLLQTAAHDPGMCAVVSEGAGSRWFADDLRSEFPAALIQLPFSAVATVATAVFSDSLPPARLEQLVDDIAPRPILLIWTSKGIGGEWFNPNYFDAAGEPKTIWEIPESTHIDGLATRPAEYERRVIDFFDNGLADCRSTP